MSNTAMQEQDYEKDVKVDFSIWKRLLSYVFRYKKTAIALMLCNVGIAVIGHHRGHRLVHSTLHSIYRHSGTRRIFLHSEGGQA